MKIILLISTLFFSITSFTQIQTDKVAHFGVGYITGVASSSIILTHTKGKNEWFKSVGIGIGTGIVIGTGKELYDEWKYNGFDFKDLGVTVLGSALGSVSIKITITQYKKRYLYEYSNK